jgi:hypothetical protein
MTTNALGPRMPIHDPRLPPEPPGPIPAPEPPPPYPIDPEPYPRYEDVPPTDPVDTDPVELSHRAAQAEVGPPSSHRRAGARS